MHESRDVEPTLTTSKTEVIGVALFLAGASTLLILLGLSILSNFGLMGFIGYLGALCVLFGIILAMVGEDFDD